MNTNPETTIAEPELLTKCEVCQQKVSNYFPVCRACTDARAPVAVGEGDAISREAVLSLVNALLVPVGEPLEDRAAESFSNGVRHAGGFLQERLRALPAIQSAPTESARKAAFEIAEALKVKWFDSEIEQVVAIITRHIGKVKQQDWCWHCGVVLASVSKPRCEDCPDECDEPDCDEMGCEQLREGGG